MPRSHFCEIVVLLDRSGSMTSIAADMRGGFDQFVADQRAQPGDAVLTLVQFDHEGGLPNIDTVYEAKPLADVPSLVLEPRGTTPLLDALGRTIAEVGARLHRMPEAERPDRVLFLTITDGYENASVTHTKGSVRA